MPELLLELGVEELPATSVRKAYTDLADHLRKAMHEAGLVEHDSSATVFGTPRRLIVSFPDVKDRQEDQVKEQRGPSLQAAYDAEGNPSKALLGFCRSQGIEPSELRNDGQYVWVTKHVPGRPAGELLGEFIPKAIRSLTFDKTMRWGSARMRFARPIRWLLASFGGELVPFEIEGVASGLQSRGHRFYAPEEFSARSFGQLVEGLRARKVEPDPEIRRAAIVEQSLTVAPGTPDMADALVDENVFLTEWPTAITGQFRDEFEELPVPVLVTAMAKHEKMFPVRDSGGKLTTSFVFIRNSGEDDTVRRGSEWVLNARFNDAKFFYDEDKKHSLNDFLEKTSGILFQDKLGTVRQRAERLAKLAHQLALFTGADEEEAEFARLAGLFAKADLSTGLVSELASLQGIIGGEYAAREGLPAPVSWAISSQYDPSKNPAIDTVEARTAARLLMADQLDKLAGFLGLGLAPSGSSDPFGLRRAATLLIEVAWLWPIQMESGFLSPLLWAQNGYEGQGFTLDDADVRLGELFASRFQALLPDVRYDLHEAALEGDPHPLDPRSYRVKLAVLERLANDVPFVQTATRPLNIVSAARKKSFSIGQGLLDLLPSRDPNHSPFGAAAAGKLDSGDGLALFDILDKQEAPLAKAVQSGEVEEIVRLLLNLAGPINRFFESTMVMVDDPDVRFARLTLLSATAEQLSVAGDWTKIVIEG